MQQLRILGAIFLIFGCYFTAEFIAPLLPIQLPVPLIGLVLLFCVLSAIKHVPKALTVASRPLLQHMALFFIPAVLGIWHYKDFIVTHALGLFLAVVCSTLVVFALVATFAQRLLKGDT